MVLTPLFVNTILVRINFFNGSIVDVEDGHTLHLVVRQPIPPLSESSTSNAGLFQVPMHICGSKNSKHL